MMHGATIDAMADSDRISLDDDVFVHGHSIIQDHRGSWWAYSDGSFLFSIDRDDLLTQIANARHIAPDLGDLNARLDRALARAEARRLDDGNKPPGSARCSKCGGLGTISKGAGRVTCPTCNGVGTVPTSS